MKHIVTILAITVLFSGASLQSKIIRAVKDFRLNPLTSVTVTLKQDNNKPESVTFKRSTDDLAEQLSYDPNGGDISISANIEGKESVAWGTPQSAQSLVGTEIRIVKDKEKPGYTIKLKNVGRKNVSAPKKQKIRAYKHVDLDKNYTIVVHSVGPDGKQKKSFISEVIFKQNTDYKAKKLYLQLNSKPVDATDMYAEYNKNNITVTNAEGTTIFDVILEAQPLKPTYQIQVTEKDITIVDSKDFKPVPNLTLKPFTEAR